MRGKRRPHSKVKGLNLLSAEGDNRPTHSPSLPHTPVVHTGPHQRKTCVRSLCAKNSLHKHLHHHRLHVHNHLHHHTDTTHLFNHPSIHVATTKHSPDAASVCVCPQATAVRCSVSSARWDRPGGGPKGGSRGRGQGEGPKGGGRGRGQGEGSRETACK